MKFLGPVSFVVRFLLFLILLFRILLFLILLFSFLFLFLLLSFIISSTAAATRTNATITFLLFLFSLVYDIPLFSIVGSLVVAFLNLLLFFFFLLSSSSLPMLIDGWIWMDSWIDIMLDGCSVLRFDTHKAEIRAS